MPSRPPRLPDDKRMRNAHPAIGLPSRPTRLVLIATVLSGHCLLAGTATAAAPEIRQHQSNRVPACVTPERLMEFLKARNPGLDRRFERIATWYRQHGEAWRVRWDYAFFQMAIETNYLSFRRPDGRSGDVDPRQNNFAGIGTTGGGVPGDRFPDVKTGVLAQIQHLVAYSGEPIAAPVAPRTALKQGDIVSASRNLGRAVRFSDLARRWAADPRYGRSIEFVADSFRREQCPTSGDGRDAPRANGRDELPWRRSSALDAATDAKAPEPQAAVRPRQIVRTIWKRGDPVLASRGESDTRSGPTLNAPLATPTAAGADGTVAPAPPSQLVASQTQSTAPVTVAKAIDTSERSGLLGSLANMAQAMEMPIVAPAPRLAQRAP